MSAEGPFTLRRQLGGRGVELAVDDPNAVCTTTDKDLPAQVVVRFTWKAVEALQAGLAQLTQAEMDRLRTELSRWVRSG